MGSRFALGVVLVLVVALCPARAWAYIDVGAGSVVLQAVIAFFVGALYAVKVYWAQLRTWMFGREEPPDDAETSEMSASDPASEER